MQHDSDPPPDASTDISRPVLRNALNDWAIANESIAAEVDQLAAEFDTLATISDEVGAPIDGVSEKNVADALQAAGMMIRDHGWRYRRLPFYSGRSLSAAISMVKPGEVLSADLIADVLERHRRNEHAVGVRERRSVQHVKGGLLVHEFEAADETKWDDALDDLDAAVTSLGRDISEILPHLTTIFLRANDDDTFAEKIIRTRVGSLAEALRRELNDYRDSAEAQLAFLKGEPSRKRAREAAAGELANAQARADEIADLNLTPDADGPPSEAEWEAVAKQSNAVSDQDVIKDEIERRIDDAEIDALKQLDAADNRPKLDSFRIRVLRSTSEHWDETALIGDVPSGWDLAVYRDMIKESRERVQAEYDKKLAAETPIAVGQRIYDNMSDGAGGIVLLVGEADVVYYQDTDQSGWASLRSTNLTDVIPMENVPHLPRDTVVKMVAKWMPLPPSAQQPVETRDPHLAEMTGALAAAGEKAVA